MSERNKKPVCPESTIESANRRSFVRKAALATASFGVASTVLGRTGVIPSSEAADGSPILIGKANSGCLDTTSLTVAGVLVGFQVKNISFYCCTLAVCGNSCCGTGVMGTATSESTAWGVILELELLEVVRREFLALVSVLGFLDNLAVVGASKACLVLGTASRDVPQKERVSTEKVLLAASAFPEPLQLDTASKVIPVREAVSKEALPAETESTEAPLRVPVLMDTPILVTASTVNLAQAWVSPDSRQASLRFRL
jgi:hypothetical protein